jgi:tryptophanyl-tRNA synthetase
MGLTNPEKKMSKSEENKSDAIFLLDSPDEIRAKIKRATTDSQREICFDEKRPGVTNLLTIYELLTGKSRSEIEDHFSGKNYKDLKEQLAEVVIESLRPLQERYDEITSDHGTLDGMLKRGAERAAEQAVHKMSQVHASMGLR